jgi:tRNA (guanosine-2'-O-)-methyltransferase
MHSRIERTEHDSLMDALAQRRGIVPGRASLELDGRTLDPGFVIQALGDFVSEARRDRIDRVLAGRTRTVTPVVEGIVNLGNVSAVMRTAEALGFQDLHVITGQAQFKDSKRTSIGAEKWLDVYDWPTPSACAEALRAAGYRILVTHLDETARPIDSFDFTQPTAIVLGNERDGASREMLDVADDRCILPMSGFSQSYNISVAAAIALYHAYSDRIRRSGRHGDLSEETRETLRAAFYRKSVKSADEILRRADVA